MTKDIKRTNFFGQQEDQQEEEGKEHRLQQAEQQ